MAAPKRSLEDSSLSRKVKKVRVEFDKKKDDGSQSIPPSKLQAEEVDFPRGGGTSFTPLEVKAIRAEAVKEANAEIFTEDNAKKSRNKKKTKSAVNSATSAKPSEGKDRIRIEHLNYKRINVGMKIFGQIISILPLVLIVSLPNQLFAHIPITNISSQFTELLERIEAQEPQSDYEDDEDGEDTRRLVIPELGDIFKVGQYVRTSVSAVYPPGTTDVSGIGKTRDESIRASKRVELSLIPERVNTGIEKADLKQGFTLTAAVKSREDHGYTLDFGINDVSGFLLFKDADQGHKGGGKQLCTGSLIDVTIIKVSASGRVCTVSADKSKFSTSHLTEISSVTSIPPGILLQALITNVHTTGLNLQVLGYFDGTVDEFHLGKEPTAYKVGKKVKARVLYDHSSSPPKFALSLLDHVVQLRPRLIPGSTETVLEAYPVGTVLEAVKVLRVESERGLTAEVSDGVEGFVHISQASDDHLPSLSSTGPWKPGSIHPARVTGYFTFDGLLQLCLKPSVIQQKYLQPTDVEVGEIVTGTIKNLTDACLFVSLSRSVDGVVWPNHYADIMLKHPAKRFKERASIKCRILVVDPDRKRIALTAKKTLLNSSLPIISKLEDVKLGMVTHAVVYRTYDKHLVVEFYNNVKATVPLKEIGETPKSQLSETFLIGRVVKVRILGMDGGRITASIKQASANFDVVTDISSIDVGHTVEGKITEIHKDNILITLQPTRIRALLSLKNLANHRNETVTQLICTLKVGENLEELIVVSRNPDKALVIVANKPKQKPPMIPKGSNITMESIDIGRLIGGRVTQHIRNGALVKITSQIGGILHFSDLSDNFDAGVQLPGVDSIIKATVVGKDVSKKQLALSIRPSRTKPDHKHEIVDQEINHLSEVKVGQSVRGFVKNVMEHGLFVTIGREIDARVQIRELFDEYIKDWQGHFKVHQVVKGRILSIDSDNKKIEMSLRTGGLSAKRTSSITLSDLKEGQKVEGSITKIEDYGLFIQIAGSKLSGLCHKSQLSDNPGADVTVALRGFRQGDRVKAIILKIDNRRISLGLKPSYFSEGDFEENDEDAEGQNGEADEGVADDIADEQVADQDQDVEMASEDSDDMEIDVDGNQLEFKISGTSPSGKTPSTQGPTLSSIGGFQWPGTVHQPEDDEGTGSSSSDEDEAVKPGKKKRKRKAIEQDLTADMHTKTPESNADFERLLLGSPNSSYLWVQYMSFQLPLSEVDKAREVGRRALKTINFREEQERLNVWIALLNLENVYGTGESLEATFKEAARANDSKTIHLRLAAIFEQSDKPEKAEEQYKRTSKKFGQSSKVWTLFAQFLLKRGKVEEARKLLPRGLQSLEKRKHLKTISQFALLEYKHGDPERGKTLFEGIIDSHPKRWDMWSVYMDMEGTQRNIQNLRNLFGRVFALKMTSHKAKAFFKKWLELEKRIGDEEGVEVVKQKAVEWTQRAASNGSS